ncbi:MAG: hypothetical protein MSQ05_07110 [Akkermansia sp.]|nr:hypothetical protein [Akkermansia sp.]
MALHIEMSPEAEAELRKSATRNKVTSAALALLLISLAATVLYFAVKIIVKTVEPSFISFTPPEDNAPPTNKPTTQELSSSSSSPSSDVAPAMIVADAPANVAMAPVEMDSADFGEAADFGIGMGAGGLGEGLGDGGSGLGSSKGGGSALEGTFYDLKQTKSGSPSGNPGGAAGRPKTLEALYEFTSKGWKESTLSKYWQSPTKLYATNFYLPNCNADYAPEAYQCKDRVKPSAWVAVYRGRVQAPKTATYRFVGTGDDMLLIRFDNKTVLEAGWCIISQFKNNPNCGGLGSNADYRRKAQSGEDKDHKGYQFFTTPDTPYWNQWLGGLTAGSTFEVKQGKSYPIEILITEIPGGQFSFAVLLQEVVKGEPKKELELFRTNFSEPNEEELRKLLQGFVNGKLECPKYSADSPVWKAVP